MSGSDHPGGRGGKKSLIQKMFGRKGPRSSSTSTPPTTPPTAPTPGAFANLPRINVPHAYTYRDTPGSSSTPSEAQTPSTGGESSPGGLSSPGGEESPGGESIPRSFTLPHGVVAFDTDIDPRDDHVEDTAPMSMRLYVHVYLGVIQPSNRVSRLVRNIMSRFMEETGFNWKAISTDMKEFYWQEYKKEVWWYPPACSESRMKKLFMTRASQRYTDLMNYWKKNMKGKNKKKEVKYPPWDKKFVKALQDYWIRPEVVRKSEQNRLNRMGKAGDGTGGYSTHRGGPIGVAEWMYKKKSGPEKHTPDIWETVEHLHGKPGEIRYEKMNELCTRVVRQYEKMTQNPDPEQPPPSFSTIYVEELGGKKYGKMLGLGQVGRTMHLQSGIGGSSLGTSIGGYSDIDYQRVLEAEENILKLKEEMDERDRAMQERQKAIEKREQIMEERDRVREERDRAREERDKVREEAFQRLQQNNPQMQQYWQSPMPQPRGTPLYPTSSDPFGSNPNPNAGFYIPVPLGSEPTPYMANIEEFPLYDALVDGSPNTSTRRPPRSRRNHRRSQSPDSSS